MPAPARRRAAQLLGVSLLVATLLAACAAPAAREAAPSQPRQAPALAAPKRVVAAVQSYPATLNSRVGATVGGATAGVDALEELLHTGLTTPDAQGTLRPRLAEAVPTVENGLWVVLPDGRMETTWRLKPDLVWHDNAPFTIDDLIFTVRIGQDRELPVFRDPAFDAVESVEARDDRTVTVRWKSPFIKADTMFSRLLALPLPRHLLERTYTEDKTAFVELPYWSSDFIGMGPYRMREFSRNSHIAADANPRYVMGRPKIDELEVRFIADSSTLLANVLAGAVEVTMGRALSLEQATYLREQWRDGTVDIAPQSWMALYPQLLSPNPALVGDPVFRRALLHAIDRQEMVDTLQFGLVQVAHVYISPNVPEYREIEPSVVKYDYDPRRATQLLDGLGLSKGTGGFYVESSGRRLSLGIQATAALEIQVKSALAVADNWQRIGIAAEPDIVPPQRVTDAEYRATFPAFSLPRQPNDVDAITRAHSRYTPLPENNFTGLNRTRYRDPQFDALIDRYMATIPFADRMRVLGQIVHQMTDQLLWMGLFYDAEPTVVGKRVAFVTARAQTATQAWNAHEWDVR